MTRDSSASTTGVDNDDAATEASSGSKKSQQKLEFSKRKSSPESHDDGDDVGDHDNDDVMNEESSNRSTPDQEKTTASATRRSSRSTAFRGQMKDPDTVAELMRIAKSTQKRAKQHQPSSLHSAGKKDEDGSDDDGEEDSESGPNKQSPTSKGSKTQRRATKRSEAPLSEDDLSEEEYISEEEEEEEEENENDDMKIQRIIAAKSLTRKDWKTECQKMNTSEITRGSRWIQEEEIEQKDLEKYEERYLVKWAGLSFLHCSWETEKDLTELIDGAKGHLSIFFRKSVNGLLFNADERQDGDYFDPSWIQIERILDASEDKVKGNSDDKDPVDKYGMVLDIDDPKFSEGTGRNFYVKWVNTPYSQSSFENERDLIIHEIDYQEQLASFFKRQRKPRKDEMNRNFKKGDDEMKRLYKIFGENLKMSGEVRDKKIKDYQSKLESHVFRNGGKLRDYQAEGVSWLMANHVNRRSSILADEMGLGKTIQTATYINTVATQLLKRGPFLIVAPLSTIPHWYREFTGWTELNTIVYHGSALDREHVREDEFVFPKDRIESLNVNQKYLNKVKQQWRSGRWEKTWMVNVVITTPEMLVADDYAELTAVEWEILVVDEAHRLKNHNSKLANNLRDPKFVFHHSLLLTGTPIQNNMQELWTLLHFIDSDNFSRLSEFMERYGDIKSKERVDELHENIRPYILRRLKEDVEKSVPPKEETLIEVELTVLQKQYYRALYEKNLKFLRPKHKKSIVGPSMNNLAIQLRKCCNHPFLLNGVEADVRAQQPDVSYVDGLVNASGKLVLLDKLLPRLKSDGHRILIFSQFKIMLDIIEDYLHLRQFKCERIDGSIQGLKRQAAIDRFQAKIEEGREPPFIMLLSTRAGGVGINLTAADTCIIFDSDWNPQNDLQAQARCHRIGQTKNVKIYRLLTRKTYEMQMFHMSSLKMGLDQAVLQGIENTGGSKDIMTKEEVEKLLKHGAYDIFREEKDGTSEKESNDFISQDIDSILARRTKTVIHDNTGSKSSAAGGTFSKASFKASGTNSDGIAVADVDVDDPDFWTKVVGEEKEEEDHIDLSGKKRKRTKANYNYAEYFKQLDDKMKDGAEGEDDNSVASEFDGCENSDNDEFDNTALKKIKNAAKAKNKVERSSWGGALSTEWTVSDVDQVLKTLQSFGYGNIPWEAFKSCMSLSKSTYPTEEIRRMAWALALLCLLETAEEDALEASRRSVLVSNKRKDGQTPRQVSVLNSSEAKPSEELNALADNDGPNTPLEAALQKLLAGHQPWVSKALADAMNFSVTATPRDKNIVDQTVGGMNSLKTVGQETSPLTKLAAAFDESIWPALRSRGWKNDKSDNSKRIRYTYQKKVFKSIPAILDAIPKYHPELINMVNSTILAVSDSLEVRVPTTVGLSTNNLTAKALKQFLMEYAPMQIVADRVRPHRLCISRRLLSLLTILQGVHSMIELADSKLPADASIDSRDIELLKLVQVNKKAALPHAGWIPKHDVTLIRAIAKHGWLDRQTRCVAIAEDKTISWGPPFDTRGKNKIGVKENPLAAEDDKEINSNYSILLRVASRAAQFLNNHASLVEEFRGFNTDGVVKSYGLERCTSDESSSHGNDWTVNKVTLKSIATTDHGDIAECCEELPSRKDLLRRAKLIVTTFLGSAINLDEDRGDTDPKNTVPGTKVINDVAHSFSTLDQGCRCNVLLAEMLRGLLKTTQKQGAKACSELAGFIFLEISSRLDDKAKSKGSEIYSEELLRLRKDVSLFLANFRKGARAAKNILRVILGIDPVPSKVPSDPLFPVEIEIHDRIRSHSAVAKAALSKVNKKAYTPADAALNRALASLKDVVDNTDETTSEHLRLTSTEILMLTVLASQGLPVFCDDWGTLVNMDGVLNADFDLDNFKIYFFAMAGVMEAAAKVWLDISKKSLRSKLDSFGSEGTMPDSMRQKLVDEIALLQKDNEAKRMTLADAKYYNENPFSFARKVIMLLDAVRRHMGPVDLHYVGDKKIRALNKSENGLGTKVLNWLSKELQKWAGPLECVDKTGNVLASSCIRSGSHPQAHGSALMTKRDCRTVFIQVAQQTRLRSIFIEYGITRLGNDFLPKALKHLVSSGESWEGCPSWWNEQPGNISTFQDDLDLLVGILDYGYGGFDCMLRHDFSFCRRLKAGNPDGINVSLKTFTRATVQSRVNQFTRELSSIVDTEVMLKLLIENRSSRSKPELETPSDDVNGKKRTAKSGGGIQSELHAFFKQPCAGKGENETEAISVESSPETGEITSSKRKETDSFDLRDKKRRNTHSASSDFA